MQRGFVLAATLVAAWGTCVPAAWAVCRVVEPVEESGNEPVMFDPTTMALFVIAPEQVVDYHCPPEPREDPVRALEDRLQELPPNVATIPVTAERGLPAVEPDPTICWDGSEARAELDTLVHVVMQPSIYADGGSAGLIMPVPSRADVHVGPDGLMEAVSNMQRAEVRETVTFTEDPSLGYQCSDPHYSDNSLLDSALGAPLMLYGCGDMESGDYYRPGLDDYETETETNDGGVVELERIPTTDDYEVTMLSASSLEALTIWLDDNGFAHSEVDDRAFSAYVKDGAWFMAVKVTPQELGGEHVALAPLIVTWRGDTVPITNELQYQPGGGIVVTDAFVVAPERMRVEDGDGETLYAAPETFRGNPMVEGFGLGEGWLTRIELTRQTHQERADTKLVPMPEGDIVRPVIERDVTVRIAAPCCEGGDGQTIPDSDGVRRSYTENRTYIEGEGPEDDYFRTTPPPDPAYCPGGSSYDESYGYRSSGGYDYSCAVEDRRTRRRLAVLGSWLPLLSAFALILWRRRRR